MPILKKLVEVEATERDVIDYLRSLMGASIHWRTGDVVRVATGDHQHMRRGTLAVVRGYDVKDDTVQVLYWGSDGYPHGCWAGVKEVEMLQRMPVDWAPTALAMEALEASRVESDLVEEANQRTKEMGDPLAAMKHRRGWGV